MHSYRRGLLLRILDRGMHAFAHLAHLYGSSIMVCHGEVLDWFAETVLAKGERKCGYKITETKEDSERNGEENPT
jgi:hypothetical protein